MTNSMEQPEERREVEQIPEEEVLKEGPEYVALLQELIQKREGQISEIERDPTGNPEDVAWLKADMGEIQAQLNAWLEMIDDA